MPFRAGSGWLACRLLACGVTLSGAALAQVAANPPFKLVVHADNPTATLTASEVSRMFLGQLTHWPDGIEVLPVEGPPHLRSGFARQIHRRSEAAIQSYWQRRVFGGDGEPPARKDKARAVLSFVRRHRGAIGYVSAVTPVGPGLRVARVDDRQRPSHVDDRQRSSRNPPVPEVRAARGDGGSVGGVAQRPGLLTVDPLRPGTIYVAPTDGGLLRSSDGGETWHPAQLGLGHRPLIDLVANAERAMLFAIDGQTLYRSLDGAESWQSMWTLAAKRIVLDPSAPDAVYLPTPGGLSRSDDRGVSFTDLQVPVDRGFSSLVISRWGRLWAAAEATVWISDDRGQQWRASSSLPIRTTIEDLAVDASGHEVVYAATARGLFRGDRGREWRTIGPDDAYTRIFVTPELLLAVGARSLYTSRDRGTTWMALGFAEAVPALDPRTPNRLLALGTNGRLAESMDQGQIWRLLYNFAQPAPAEIEPLSRRRRQEPTRRHRPLQLACGADREHVASIQVDPVQPNRVYAAGWHGIFRSDDFGHTWEPASAGLEIADVHALAIDPVHRETLYAGTHGAGIFKSTDGGNSWQPARTGLQASRIHSLLVDPTLPSTVYAGTASGLYVSLDAGETWRRHPGGVWQQASSTGVPPHPNATAAISDLRIDPSDKLRWVGVSSRGELWRGDAASLDWTPIGLAKDQNFDVVVAPEAPCGWRGRSTGRCRACRAIDEAAALAPTRLRALLPSPGNSEVAYAASAAGLWRTMDAGATWIQQSLDANVAALAYSAAPTGSLLAGTANGLWRTTARGAWRRDSLERPVYALALDSVLPETLYAGMDGGRIARSRDGGSTWQIQTPDQGVQLPAEAPLRARPAATAAEVTPAALALWRDLMATSKRDLHQQALIATELLAQAPTAYQDLVQGKVRSALKGILDAEAAMRRGDPRELRFSPDQQWLLARYGDEGCWRCEHEIRLYDLEAPRLGTLGALPGTLSAAMAWRELHDLDLEPAHVPPRWILPDAAEILAWSRNDRFLATWDPSPRRPTETPGGLAWVWSLPDPEGREMAEDEWIAPARLVHRQPWRLGAAWERCQAPREDLDPEIVAERPAPSCQISLSGDGAWIAFSSVEPEPTERGSADAATQDPNYVGVIRLARQRGGQAEILPLWSLPLDEGASPWQALHFTQDHRHLLAFASDGSLRMVRLGSKPVVDDEAVVELGEFWTSIAEDSTGRWLAAATANRLLLWSLSTHDWQPIDLAVSGISTPLVFSDDGRWLAAHSKSGLTTLIDLEQAPPGVVRQTVPSSQRQLGVFSRDSRRWLVHGASVSQILDLARARQRVQGAGSEGADRRWSSAWPTLPSGRSNLNGPNSRFLSAGRRWLAEPQRGWVRLWDLSKEQPNALAIQVPRRGPIGPRGSPLARRYGVDGDTLALGELSQQALRDLACRVVARDMPADTWQAACALED